MLDLTICVDLVYDSTFCPPGSVALTPRDEVNNYNYILPPPLLCHTSISSFDSLNGSTSFAQTLWC